MLIQTSKKGKDVLEMSQFSWVTTNTPAAFQRKRARFIASKI
jgi:hypothetical protein